MSEGEFSGVLDLSGANVKGFDPLPSGTYDSELFEHKWDKTKGTGKISVVCPLLKVQFRVIEEPYVNRRLFDQFVIPPKDYDKDKTATMQGFLVRFLVAMGLEQDEVMSKKFNLEEALNDLHDEPVCVVVGQTPDLRQTAQEGDMTNDVKGYKRLGDRVPASARLS